MSATWDAVLTTHDVDSSLTNPKTTPTDLLLPDHHDGGAYRHRGDDDNDGSGGPARDPGYTIAKSPGKGMGLFATRFIPAHAKILDEKPVLILPAGGGDGSGGNHQILGPGDLQGFVAQVFALSPALREATMNLQGERVALWRPQMEHYREILRKEELAVTPVEDTAAAAAGRKDQYTMGSDTMVARSRRHLSLEERSQLEHILRVFYTNAAALVGPSRSSAGAAKMAHVGDGLFLAFSRINHSCEANAVWDTCRQPGVMSIRAARDIQPGEEITISYFWETAEAVEKRRERTRGWGFVCQCLKCGPIRLE